MRPIEFYTTPGGEVTIKEIGMPERQLKESDTEFIQRFLEVLEEFYPEAYKALREAYTTGTDCGEIFLQYVDSLNVISVYMIMKLILMKIGTLSLNSWDARCEVNVQGSRLFVSRNSTAIYQIGNLK